LAYLLVFTTVPAKKEARKLADLILSRRLAACVHISAAGESHYWWKGKKEKAAEYVLWIKTGDSLFSRLEKALRQAHPYEVPEIIAVPVKKGSSPYLSWISRETKS
jgi:periplasmic divalent cation tolerance protein